MEPREVASFDEGIVALARHVEASGHCRVSHTQRHFTDDGTEVFLALWVKDQQIRAKRGTATKPQVVALLACGLPLVDRDGSPLAADEIDLVRLRDAFPTLSSRTSLPAPLRNVFSHGAVRNTTDVLGEMRAYVATLAPEERPSRESLRDAAAAGSCPPYWQLAAATGARGIGGILEALGFELTQREHETAAKLRAIRDWFIDHEPLAEFKVPERRHVMDAHGTGLTWSYTHWMNNIMPGIQISELNEELGFDPSFEAELARREMGLHAWMAQYYTDAAFRLFTEHDVRAASADGYTWSMDTWLRHTNSSGIDELRVTLHRDPLEWATRGIHQFMREVHGDDQRPPTRVDIDGASARRWCYASDTLSRMYGSLAASQEALRFDALEWALNGLRLHQLITTGDADTRVTQKAIRDASRLERSYGDEWLFKALGTSRVGGIQAALAAREATPVRIPAWAEPTVEQQRDAPTRGIER
ncbi:MAG: hypothetical protein ACOYNI_12605 [Acidimicrobiia bacterium]